MSSAWLATVISAPLGGALVALVNWIFGRRRESAATSLDTAQAARVIQGAALEMLQPLRDRIGRLELHIAALETKVHDLTTELDAANTARAAAEAERDHLRTLLGTT
ncbi:hypothetical protein [Cumulibacter soli]|uniref:hypothetical protein n=1 Tax=Cumulibacter soli TaxID=2546344 RepID=UPI00106776A5|nr:hypothetical protein [Cumulibacter soli]